ncbi:oxidoreductase ylbE [Staphylococcus petrasii]|uniref:NAD(P)-dependent oxidoreductase n=1 Tax=Staphylococcus petrasii TaxID=1276936 RepID=A0A380FZU5_9STAP|nr:SDR family oxidoreductase [Staphylococcus petrasii]PNZ24100.1 oxidoreductase [Staphylococcus petrasii]TGE11498.1 NAD(P)-dependent oxidoreductase [Staphylococcus petrasii]TGE14796.1 NAD(P)-dependent oxidoreductase [Staphylococcus petrasii]SUM43321.1 oxidoreductase ylbE [Staphylococcus petrasii]
MSILVIGANGGVGSKLVQQLKDDNVTFTAGVRKEEQVSSLKEQNIEATLVDVEKDSIEELTEKFNGFDKVIFSVGSGGSTGADKTIIVDLDGAVKAIEASKKANVKHFVMVSTYDSRREAFDPSGDLKPYTIAKHYADNHLRESGVTYTIVHPGGLKDEEGTGQIEADLYFDGRGVIPREDVAAVLKEVVTSEGKYQNQEFQIITGNQSIQDALSRFQ